MDVSSNNQHPIDFSWLTANGVTGIWVKATESNTYTNSEFISDCEAALAAGLQVGAYHFGHPGVDVTSQWNYFQAAVATAPKSLVVREALDIEVTDSASEAEIQAWVDTWHQLSANETVTYTYRSFLPNVTEFGSGLWLAWPGWTNEALPSGCIAVQTGTLSTFDVETILNEASVLKSAPTPKPAGVTTMSGLVDVATLTSGTDVVVEVNLDGSVYGKARTGVNAWHGNSNKELEVAGVAIPGSLAVRSTGSQAQAFFQLEPAGNIQVWTYGPETQNADGTWQNDGAWNQDVMA